LSQPYREMSPQCWPTPKEPLHVRGWDNLESELGRMFPQPKFSTFSHLFFASHEYVLRVTFLVRSR
jgi:hypothetical protein